VVVDRYFVYEDLEGRKSFGVVCMLEIDRISSFRNQ
jgi:hypothetical protein